MINCDLLVKKAYEGRANAYTPYSNFKVGAVCFIALEEAGEVTSAGKK